MFGPLALLLAICPQSSSPEPFPERKPPLGRVDPGIHGGRLQKDYEVDLTCGGLLGGSGPCFIHTSEGGFIGDVTPDGRLAIGYRERATGQADCAARSGLYVSIFHKERIEQDPNGSIEFFDGELDPQTSEGGSDYMMSTVEESWLLENCPRTLPADSVDPPAPHEVLDENFLAHRLTMNPLTLAFQPVGEESFGQNPYPSDEAGNFAEHGGFRTYKLWMVTPHFYNTGAIDVVTGVGTKFRWSPTCQAFVKTGPLDQNSSRLGARSLTVCVDERTVPARIESATISDFQLLRMYGHHGDKVVLEGTEPSITADGRLLVFHGDGGDNVGKSQHITYVYNENPCSPDGWSDPKSISSIHLEDEAFKMAYPIAQNPIRSYDESGDHIDLQPGWKVRGAYPWLSKDGSFLTFMYAQAIGGKGGTAWRSSMIVLGDITQGYIKRVDDVGCNPTRWGGQMDWPLGANNIPMSMELDADYKDSQMTLAFSTGLAPGLWRPFQTRHVSTPYIQHDLRVPVLPMFIPKTRMYGEARFEEADGHYLHYLACNEAMIAVNGNNNAARQVNSERTPDTSGRVPRKACRLTGGAAFPQEYIAATHSIELPGPTQTLKNYANEVGTPLRTQMAPTNVQSHENIGFQGQAILFPRSGSVVIDDAYSHDSAQPSQGSVQAFVKVLPTWNSSSDPLALIQDNNQLDLRLHPDGRFEGRVWVSVSGIEISQSVWSRSNAIAEEPTPFEPTEGWRHVALTYHGDDEGVGFLRLYVDGLLEDEVTAPVVSSFQSASGGLRIGPGSVDGGGDAAQAVLILDEVGISDVARTQAEIRRDAYVHPAHPTEPLPDEITLDVGLDRRDTFWPKGQAYSQAIVDLGSTLFASELLSAPGIDRSCATCHVPSLGFTDGLNLAQDIQGQDLSFNSPTVLNSAFGLAKLFDGDAKDLEDQVLRPLVADAPHGSEMGVQTVDDVIARINANATLAASFQAAFGGAADQRRLKQALAMYLRSLQSGDAPIDRFENDPTASLPGHVPGVTSDVLKGRALFMDKARCITCHSGSNFSDGDFHNIGTIVANPQLTGQGKSTGRSADDGKLKTPTLRNIALTGPYFHDGSRASLHEVVEHYAGEVFIGNTHDGSLDRTLFPIELSGNEIDQIVAYLESLSDITPQD